MVVRVLDHVEHCYTNEDGKVIAAILRQGFSCQEKVTLSFEGVDSVPTSFVNTAFVDLLGDFTLDFVREHLAIVNSTRQINGLIKDLMSRAAKGPIAA
ncbi:MAG: STAS-like domain-containing protein [Alphaproteobacteria bacterium]|nr:STAS-like domain-containing protein [Alphaproteobacteria bacterium]